MIVLASASPRRRILVLELRSVSQRIPAHSCLHSAQLSSDHIISSCASMQITFRGQAKQHIIQMSITQQSMDINEDYLHCAFRSRARPGFKCLGGSGTLICAYFTCLGDSGRLFCISFTCPGGFGTLICAYYGKHAESVIGVDARLLEP